MNKAKSLNNIRREYKLNKLTEESVHRNPFKQFEIWFDLVLKMDFVEPNAMILATADNKFKPSLRVVLLRGISSKGITFFTNYYSRKGKELLQNSSAALLFYWRELERQVRIEGKIIKISRAECQKYFDTRPVESRIAAWASEQSKEIPNREYLEKRFKLFKKKFSGEKIPVPQYWGGFRLAADYFEFWQGRENRLHDRICYKKSKRSWKIFRLAP
ncbi:MAG: pyridoxamine 5'-phosphate oxidase [Ignavibacteriaceae bacterium]|nr:pyridoxamine 5'-phosphate oxidase [Ignavibacteriaceae bacterium]MCW8960967.1 pyridoxamine 5'-phosphate oxidase [Ignavibacteriaceae bacterium]MCW9098533.1 pyridoxamine 5'-phosphate oxidase [Ignavibacteriaceae bacterium]